MIFGQIFQLSNEIAHKIAPIGNKNYHHYWGFFSRTIFASVYA